jgi:hypothetical protein
MVVCPPLFLNKNMQIENRLAKRTFYNITLDYDLIKQIKILAAQLDMRQNELIEEAIKDVLQKYIDLDRQILLLSLPKDAKDLA